jgi:peptidoglycan/xylan/chitin deacetylase (PgdA/CDA1 family)
MLYDDNLNGADLPPRSLCLTYDDGPGPHTLELARYLFEQGIPAAFFVIGRLAAEALPLLKQLRAWNHVVGNHTWSHAGLVDLALRGGDVVEEIAKTDVVIRPLVDGPVLLRPPYGSWRQKSRPNGPQDASTSIVAEQLRGSGRFEDYVGPILWDIVAEDWECWRQGVSVAQCARQHLQEIDCIGRGIVLMHDGSEDDALRLQNRTMQMTAQLVPELKKKHYRFVDLPSVPQIRAALAACRECALNGRRS